MKNYQISSQIKNFQKIRRDWINILSETPNHSNACHHILSINAKIELLTLMWNWSDESVDFPSPRD